MNKLTPKLAQEKISISFDFSNVILSSDYISSTSWSASTIQGTDTTPTAILVGPTSHSAKVANHIIGGGTTGAIYQIDCTVTTNTGLIYVLSGEMEIKTDTHNYRQELANYCLRSLGAPVVNIEVDSEQLADRIEDAISHYHEYHFDGIEKDYYVHKITGTQLSLSDASMFVVGDTASSLDETTKAIVLSISGNTITINRQIGYDKFQVNQTIKKLNTGSTSIIQSIVLGDIDNGYIPAEDDIVGVKKILNITSILGSGDYIFNVQYQIMMSEIQNLTAGSISYFYGVQQYLGHLDFIMKKEKDFRFNRRMNRLYLDISWGVDVNVGDVVVAEIYRAIDDEQYPEMLHDIWLRRYTTALIKRQWGANLKKYEGMQLPGGLTYNGQKIYDEAVDEVSRLEAEALYSTSPLDWFVG